MLPQSSPVFTIALREDIANAYLSNFKALLSAEVFTDLLGQAEYLLKLGYKNPTASLGGAILD